MKIQCALRAINRFLIAALASLTVAVLFPSLAIGQEPANEVRQSANAAPAERAPQGGYLRGLKAWAQNCARCHNARDPKEYSDVLWKPIVTHMRIRAGLTGQQARDILEFLQESN